MREKLELKIIIIVLAMLVAGIALAGAMTMLIQKSTLYDITREKAGTTAEMIKKDIEMTMLEKGPDLTKKLIDSLRRIPGIAGLMVVNAEGREAFKKDASLTEAEAMKKIITAGESVVIEEAKRYIFYKPLENAASCKGCHSNNGAVLGAIKISLSIEKEYERAKGSVITVILLTMAGALAFSLVLWLILRRMVILPIKIMENAALNLAKGDLSFDVGLSKSAIVERLSTPLKEAVGSVGRILHRIRDVSARATRVVETVGKDSKKMLDGAQIETEAIVDISSSVEQLNAAISEITESTEKLASSTEETAASMEEMANAIGNVKNNTHDLSGAVDATSSSIAELSATIKEVANNADNLSSATEETLSAIEEMMSSVKEVEANAKESANLSQKVMADASTFGMGSIEKTMEGMKNIKSSVEKTNDFVKKLGVRSEEIGKILNVIDDITDQTTLLALNAAILAAQAGERGKGFSVVAEEIKDLAERTAFSTQEIGSLIQSVQQEVKGTIQAVGEGLRSVDEGLRLSKDASDALEKILDSSKKSSEMALSIDRSTGEQAQAIRLVSEAMERIKNMTGMIAKATAEQAKGAALIMGATEKVRDISHQVRVSADEQAATSRHISAAIELVSEKSQQISKAIYEQKIGSNQMWKAIEKIKDLPKSNRDLAFNVNNLLRSLEKDADLIDTEVGRFKFPEGGDDKDILRFGIVPLGSLAETLSAFSPLTDYLGGKLGRKIELRVAVDFEEACKDIGQNITQLCSMGPSSYITARRRYDNIAVIAKALREGKPYQHAVIISRPDKNINSVEELKGKIFAFVDAYSTTGYIVPRAMLLEDGIDMNDFHHYNYLGSHDNVAKAVLSGDFDAGGVMENTAHRFKEQGLKFLKVSGNIPEFNICVNKSLSQEEMAVLRSALTSLTESTPEGSAVLRAMGKSYTGFTEAKDEDYAGIKSMMIKLGMLS